MDRSSEHLTNFDIRSSGDFSAGKPHVSVARRIPKVNIPTQKFNNLGVVTSVTYYCGVLTSDQTLV
nr:MAG TPA: hypothetical protein [Caudoviricetes sp.]